MPSSELVRREQMNGWLFLAPSLLLLTVFMAYPILWSLWMSFQVGKAMNVSFGGFANINRLLHDAVFFKALGNTMLFFVIQVPIMLVLALITANVLNDSKIFARSIFRTAIFLPCVTSLVAYSILFKSMFANDGLVNNALMTIGLIRDPILWVSDPFWAKVLVITAITWRWTGYNMIFYLAALQNIDRSIYEAARIDGVRPFAQFTRITVPLLKPVILFTSITSTIGTLQLFDEVYNLTDGGPAQATTTLSLYLYNLTFRFMPNFGYAATLSYVIVLLVAGFSLLQMAVARERRS